MRFENPMMLLGLIAVLLPLVLHLWYRRRAQIVGFAALHFLLRTNRRLARRIAGKRLAHS